MTGKRRQREVKWEGPGDASRSLEQRDSRSRLEQCARALTAERQRYAALLSCLQVEVWVWPSPAAGDALPTIDPPLASDARAPREAPIAVDGDGNETPPSGADALGPDWLQRVEEDDRAQAAESWHEALLSQNVYRHRCRVREGGASRWVEVRAAPVRRVDGKAHEWVGVLVELPPAPDEGVPPSGASEPDELTSGRSGERSDHELGEFAHVISHDLKAPLRGINQACQFLMEDEGPRLSEQAQLLLGEISQRATKMRGLIDGVLRYSEATLSDERHVVDVAEVLNEALFAVRPSDDFEFRFHVRPATLYLEYNQTQLLQVFQNLLDNAVKYGSGGRRAEVSCEVGAQWLTFSVKDYGNGVPEHLRTRIFRLFESGSGTMGAGVGLSIARKIVERHGGAIWMEAFSNQAGACFKFTVPRTLLRHYG